MIYILSGLTGLLILVALFTFIHKRRHSEDPETIVAELMRYVKKD